MQAIEIETTIDTDGMVRALMMPAAYKKWYGSQAKLIILLPDILRDEQSLEKDISPLEKTEPLTTIQQDSPWSSPPTTARKVNIMQYAGKINWPVDGLAYQHEVRDEWQR